MGVVRDGLTRVSGCVWVYGYVGEREVVACKKEEGE